MPRYFIPSLLRFIFNFLFRTLTRLKVEDFHNVPKEGGYILATNHLSVLDPPLIFILLDRFDITALVAKKHQKNPIFRSIINALSGIWLNREEADTRAVRQAKAHLQSGGVLGIAPEGTRSPTKALMPAKTGAAYLADQARVPILPTAIIGTENALPEILTLRRPRITVRFGKPFHLLPIDRKDRDAGLKRNTDEIMSRIAALLPTSYQGVYADHPRVRELYSLEKEMENS
jgi:1-acyl-sn-glycerol-3-phosphate acyltransferase